MVYDILIYFSITSNKYFLFILQSVSAEIQLADDFVYYFGLFLIKKEEGSDNASRYTPSGIRVQVRATDSF